MDTAGESALVLVRGRRSHAFHEGAVLAAPGAVAAEVDDSGLFATERLEVELVEPSLGWPQVREPQRAAALSRFVDGIEGLLASRG